MTKLYRCQICGDPYVGSSAPDNCPFCGAHKEFMLDIADDRTDFDIELNKKDKANVEKALEVEISNAAFYACAAKKTNSEDGKQLFKALKKVEAEHADIWKKILKLDSISEKEEPCHEDNVENLQESHDRETRAIEFYKEAADEAQNERVKEIFEALVVVEEDHLELSEDRLK